MLFTLLPALHETLYFALTCKAMLVRARSHLYANVTLYNPSQATAFVRTMTECEDLALMVRHLTIRRYPPSLDASPLLILYALVERGSLHIVFEALNSTAEWAQMNPSMRRVRG